MKQYLILQKSWHAARKKYPHLNENDVDLFKRVMVSVRTAVETQKKRKARIKCANTQTADAAKAARMQTIHK